ncbi:hypothetical protein N7495_009287 [Penicillium taxi]|uniref:uncharacterized protein n=1 Tax=Penicillium taxi TaxID=168475 RepID=UPI0025452560|nr:uncharacterized protein N7495_009287 [Penicillium taxi]KAJ5884777.1 hypothetical protein N7495_009287 [Penicillium taxi]
MSPINLDSLPYDSFYEISKYLDDNDLISLSRVNKALRQTLESEQIARKAVKNFLLFSKEGQAATNGDSTYRRAMGHRADIHEAIATASPFSVAVLAHADQFTYHQGVLCYQVEDQIRLLDVHGSAREERVLNLKQLKETLGQMEPHITTEDRIRIVHYSEDIVSVKIKGLAHQYLIAIDMQPLTDSFKPESTLRDRIVYFSQLDVDDFFIRNSRSFIWLGVYHEVHSVGMAWDITATNLDPTQPHEDVCFVLDAEWAPDWETDIGSSICFEIFDEHLYVVSTSYFGQHDEVHSSFYYWQCLGPSDSEKKAEGRIWRRKHNEGPVNELWTMFTLERDETTNRPMIVECRREWLHGNSENHRSYYVEPLPIPEEAIRAPEEPVPQTWAQDEQEDPVADDEYDERPAKRQRRHEEYEPISDKFILARTRHRGYHLASSTFLDVVSTHNSSRLLLRTCPTRKRHYSIAQDHFYTRGVHFWPPEDAPRALLDIVCPDENSSEVSVYDDERSIVYSVDCDGHSAIVLISFDPKIRFPTMGSLHKEEPPAPNKVFPVQVSWPDEFESGVITCPPLYEAINWGYWLR